MATLLERRFLMRLSALPWSLRVPPTTTFAHFLSQFLISTGPQQSCSFPDGLPPFSQLATIIPNPPLGFFPCSKSPTSLVKCFFYMLISVILLSVVNSGCKCYYTFLLDTQRFFRALPLVADSLAPLLPLPLES